MSKPMKMSILWIMRVFDGNDIDESCPVTNAHVEVPTNADNDVDDVDDTDDVDENPDNTVQINDESDGEIGDDEGEVPLSRLRPRQKTNYGHIKVKREPKDYSHYRNPSSNLHASLESTLMTQHSMKKGIIFLSDKSQPVSMTCLQGNKGGI
eukprot:scaffold132021_cov34-Attheya_sp.AAC.1